jgi:hypothetical protein
MVLRSRPVELVEEGEMKSTMIACFLLAFGEWLYLIDDRFGGSQYYLKGYQPS